MKSALHGIGNIMVVRSLFVCVNEKELCLMGYPGRLVADYMELELAFWVDVEGEHIEDLWRNLLSDAVGDWRYF